MQTATSVRSADEIVAAIEQLDLDPIMFKLMDPEEGQGWSREKVERMALEYRRYLILLAKYPERTFAPTKDIDKFWHGHILDTMKYAEDCEKTFGYYVHHFPYFGMRGYADTKSHIAAANEMASFYAAEFGETAFRTSAFCIKSDAIKRDAAFCIKSDSPALQTAFWIKSDAPAISTAFCIKSDAPVAEAAFCIKSDAPAESSAFGIKSDNPAGNAAFCIKESIGARLSPDVTTRPTLSA